MGKGTDKVREALLTCMEMCDFSLKQGKALATFTERDIQNWLETMR